MKEFLLICEERYENIEQAYTKEVLMEEATKLAAKFLGAMMQATSMLRTIDLDARTRKSGLKAIKASVYLEEAGKGDKKPTEAMLAAKVDTCELVVASQNALDEAEVDRDAIKNYLDVFREAHVYFRGIAKGKFDV